MYQGYVVIYYPFYDYSYPFGCTRLCFFIFVCFVFEQTHSGLWSAVALRCQRTYARCSYGVRYAVLVAVELIKGVRRLGQAGVFRKNFRLTSICVHQSD